VDLLKAASILFGDCSRATPDSEIYISSGALTSEQLEQVTAKAVELQAEYDSQEYSRSRQQEYPSIQECIHAILDDDLTALQEKRQAVKDKYPKESK
jgi:hypothetical protein